jgi:chromosome segregation ATPase
MEEAKSDCSMSGIAVRYQITKMSYRDFVAKYEHEPGDRQQAREVANYEAGEMGDNAGPDVHTQLAEARAQLAAAQANDEELASVVVAKDEELASVVAAKDEELASVVAAKDEELAAKDEELAAKDEELASVVAAKDEELKQLRAQLERLEGVPPQRPDKDVQ